MKKIKRILSSLLVVIMMVGIVPISNYTIKAGAEYYYNGLIYDIEYYDGTITITGCDEEKSGEVIIPSSIDGYAVIGISSYAFHGCTEITSVTIPESITSIGGCIFWGCTNLSKIQVSKNNKVYDSRNNCNAIIETAENKLIAGCKNSVILNGIKSIKQGAFLGCTGLTDIEIPNSVTELDDSAFGGTGIKSLNIPGSIKVMGWDVFSNCQQLEEVDISYGVKKIGWGAFSNCEKLKKVTIPNSVIEIGERSFEYCSALENVSIPDGVIIIGMRAFRESGLTNLTISASVRTINGYAFDQCYNLSKIEIAEENKVYDSRNNCNAIIVTATNTLYKGCNNTVIPYGVESISDEAFEFCTGLTNITIPDSVKNIGQNAFSNTGYFLDENNWENGVLYIGKHLIFVRDVTESYSIKEGTKTIADCAFWGWKKLAKITMPNSIISIGNSSFAECSNLENVTIPDGVTYIGSYAFSGCTKFTDIKIPSSVKKIDYYAFYGCTSLDNIKISNEVSYIGQEAFYDTGYYNNESNWKNNVLYINNHLISAKNDVSGFYSIKEGTKTIASNAFWQCEKLTKITIPQSVTNICDSAFTGCIGLTNIIIPDSVTNIGREAFMDCKGLQNITIPNSVTDIGINAFHRCSNLKSVVIPKNVSTIGFLAFGYIENEYYATIKKEDFKIYCYSGTAGEKYAIDNGFKYELLNEECSHKLNHITVPSTCKVAGMEYDICTECGETFNEKTLPLAAHTWGEWTVVKEATTTAEGQEKRTCSVCNKVETRTIEKLKALIDEKTGVEIIYNNEYDSGTHIKVEEKFDGDSFQLVNSVYGEVKTSIFDIATYKNGTKVQPNGEITVKIPLPTGYSKKVFVCYVDSVNGKVTKIPCEVKGGYVIFNTNHFSEYAIVEQSAGVNSVSISDVTLNYKKSTTIKPTIKADDGAKYTAKYSSSNTKVATVDENGKVYGAKKGSATITCTVTDSNGNTVTDTCKVTVKYTWWQWIIKIVLFGWIWY